MKRNATTYVGRFVIALFGLGLLVLCLKLKIWSTMGIEKVWTFCALLGLFLGYGFGGDIWGARLFDLFAHTQSRKVAEEPLPPVFEKLAQILGVVIAGFLVVAAVFIVVVLKSRG